MVAKFFIPLLLAFGVASTAGATLHPYTFSGGGNNNNADITAADCTEAKGCFDIHGIRCNDATTYASGALRCNLQQVPAGRCTRGRDTTCVWPNGAGSCVFDSDIKCVSDLYAALLKTFAETGVDGGLGGAVATDPNPSTQCPEGAGDLDGGGICNMAANNAACHCQGFDPGGTNWEGDRCGLGNTTPSAKLAANAICSDADSNRVGEGVGSLGGGLCVHIGNINSIGNCGEENFVGLDDVKVTGPRGPGEGGGAVVGTPQRQPGFGVDLAFGASLPAAPLKTTFVVDIDDPALAPAADNFMAQGIRRFTVLQDSYYPDWVFIAKAISGGTFDAAIVAQYCNASDWNNGNPTGGSCAADSTVNCVIDSQCSGVGGICDPNTFSYCHQQPSFNGVGFLWMRDLTTLEISNAGGKCPPDCKTSYDFTTYNFDALAELSNTDVPDPNNPGDADRLIFMPGGGDTRASIQAVLDNLVGPRAGKGDMILVQPLVSQTFLGTGIDGRCFIGGDPSVTEFACSGGLCNGLANAVCDSVAAPVAGDGDIACSELIGRCITSGTVCDPYENGPAQCGGADLCTFCQGTFGDPGSVVPDPPSYAVGVGEAQGVRLAVDHIQGNILGLPVGYNTHGFQALDLVDAGGLLARRMGGVAGPFAGVRVPLVNTFTTNAAAAEFRDTLLNPAFPLNDKNDLGPHVTIGDPFGIGSGGTYPAGVDFDHDPTGGGPVGTISYATNDGGSASTGTFKRAADYGSGPDGIPGCAGDNATFETGDAGFGTPEPNDPARPCTNVLGTGSATIPNVNTTGMNDVELTVNLATFRTPITAGQIDPNGTPVTAGRGPSANPGAVRPTVNAQSVLALRDITLLGTPFNTDVINKANATYCPFQFVNAAGVFSDDPNANGGAVGTGANCFEVAAVQNICGDNVVNQSFEVCDGTDKTVCLGTRNCLPTCLDCDPNTCGDNVVEGGEECDGTATGTPCDGTCQGDCTCDPCSALGGDADGDLVCGNGLLGPDNCPDFANPGQADTNSDGFGDLCQCGDVLINASFVVDVFDCQRMSACSVGLAGPGAPQCDSDKGDTDNDGDIDVFDAQKCSQFGVGLGGITKCNFTCLRMPSTAGLGGC